MTIYFKHVYTNVQSLLSIKHRSKYWWHPTTSTMRMSLPPANDKQIANIIAHDYDGAPHMMKETIDIMATI